MKQDADSNTSIFESNNNEDEEFGEFQSSEPTNTNLDNDNFDISWFSKEDFIKAIIHHDKSALERLKGLLPDFSTESVAVNEEFTIKELENHIMNLKPIQDFYSSLDISSDKSDKKPT